MSTINQKEIRKKKKWSLASFLLAALSSVLKLKGVDENGDLVLFLQALKNFEQLAKGKMEIRKTQESLQSEWQMLLLLDLYT